MTLEKSGVGTSKQLVDSPNDTVGGRTDGTGGPQRKLGHRQGKDLGNAEQRVRPFDGTGFVGRLGLQDRLLDETAITNPSRSGDCIGGQPVGTEE